MDAIDEILLKSSIEEFNLYLIENNLDQDVYFERGYIIIKQTFIELLYAEKSKNYNPNANQKSVDVFINYKNAVFENVCKFLKTHFEEFGTFDSFQYAINTKESFELTKFSHDLILKIQYSNDFHL